MTDLLGETQSVHAEKPKTAAILAGLKDFQRSTVEHVFNRLYLDADCSRRYLVADEVGLGKTLVARGVIAKTIDYLWDRTKRIDIVYVCSNADIARQNINRLNVIGCNEFALSSRITLLPMTVADLDGKRVNFVSFTPATSFDLKRSGGIARERALLYWMLKDAWQLDNKITSRPFEGNSTRKGFQGELDFFTQDNGHSKIHPGMREQFVVKVHAHPKLRATYDALLNQMPPRRKVPDEIRIQCLQWIGELRRLLAETCLRWLEPDLIILDEFQRFKHLMEGDGEGASEAAELAEHLFSFQLSEDDEATAARVLLLSATPYKAFTTGAESEQDDHHADFHLTLKFLIDDADKRAGFERLLAQYRDELFHVADRGFDNLIGIKDELERMLRSVMVRTERLAIQSERNGMLIQKEMPNVSLEVADVQQYLGLQRIAKQVSHGSMLEYWKSAPYLLNFMEEYDIKRKLHAAIDEQTGSSLLSSFRLLRGGLLDRTTVENYGRVDPGNARLRSLANDTLGREAWRLLWIPPSLPYYRGSGPYDDPNLAGYTKRLVFSCWKVVPKAIASVLSYEAERQMMRRFRRGAKNTADARKKRRGLLRFTFSDGRPTGMPVLGMLYPCRTLAAGVDPRDMLRTGDATQDTAVRAAKVLIEELLLPVLDQYQTDSEATDESWYWAAPLLLDLVHFSEETRQWLSAEKVAETWSGDSLQGAGEAADGWKKHVDIFKGLLDGSHKLGKPPEDLAGVLANFALGAPGTVLLRALKRVMSHAMAGDATQIDLCDYAAPMAHAFLTLFNHPEVMYLLRDRRGEEPYWQSVLEYSVGGNIQAMADEYLNILVESLGLCGQPSAKVAKQIAAEIMGALSLRTSTSQADVITTEGKRVRKEDEPIRFRNRFAMRFGDQSRNELGEATRPAHVRSAFNSPFWPFVLASTSVGQEGLDFHPYCHAVVHWNLPTNPVDLEQREGRIHRFKGHALRKNIAHGFADAAIDNGQRDPWAAMFEKARMDRDESQNDLYPFWISPDGPAKIERHIPLLPHSREVTQQGTLQRSLVLYRMVFGQNRQEDLLAYLQERLSPAEVAQLTDTCRIDLSPPTREQTQRPATHNDASH